jgi:hypothetical protein
MAADPSTHAHTCAANQRPEPCSESLPRSRQVLAFVPMPPNRAASLASACAASNVLHTPRNLHSAGRSRAWREHY